MGGPSRQPSNSALQLKITLLDVDPPIWRRVLVPSAITLPRLHRVFQEAMGWWDSHLHAFEIKDKHYVTFHIEEFGDVTDELIEDRVKLAGLVRVGDTFLYEYDFGDDWQHLVEVEAIESVEVALGHATCLDGARACPPEDVGSTPGYENFLEALADPTHEEHDEYVEWLGGSFDPEHFNLVEVNARLAHVR